MTTLDHDEFVADKSQTTLFRQGCSSICRTIFAAFLEAKKKNLNFVMK